MDCVEAFAGQTERDRVGFGEVRAYFKVDFWGETAQSGAGHDAMLKG